MSQLFPYQELGVEFLVKRKKALLADEMGLGKSAQAIRGLDSIRAKKIIIVCPSVAKYNWLNELNEWSDTPRNYKVCGRLDDLPRHNESVICSLDYATANYKRLCELKFEVLIEDEGHYTKAHTSRRAKALYGKDGIAWSVNRIWKITGTPAPNNASELWLMLYVFGLTKLSYAQFVERFCLTKKTSYGLKILGTNRQRIPELRELLKPIMLRRLKEDVMKDLPPITYKNYVVEPGEVDTHLLPSFVHYYFPEDKSDDLFQAIDEQENKLKTVLQYDHDNPSRSAKDLPVLEAMWESVSTYRRYVGLQKVDPVVDMVKTWFKSNPYYFEKLVIFCIHTDVIEQLRQKLKEFNPTIVYGKTPADKRQRRINKFNTNPRCKIFIANIRAAGVAVNLTAANQVLFVEQDWVPGNNAQAVMRCHRIGQEKPVFVKFVALNNSIDKHVTFVLKKKIRDLTMIFDEDLNYQD
jgi:SNF2 family DNA or RNA helicase